MIVLFLTNRFDFQILRKFFCFLSDRNNTIVPHESFRNVRIFGLLAFLLIAAAYPLTAQKQGNFWYFGNQAGLDFSNFYPIPLDNSQMNSPEGTASISDTTGVLLFYTDGMDIWNSLGQKLNTASLNGDPSSTQPAIILPDPNVANQYYVFTTKAYVDGIQTNAGVSYYTVKMTSGTAGTVTGPTPLAPNTSEKLVIVPFTYETDKTGYWLIMPELNSNRFIVVKYQGQFLSPDYQSVPLRVINDPVEYGTMRCQPGQIKVNDRSNRIALASEGGKFFELLSFNANSGAISSLFQIPAGSSWSGNFVRQLAAYGVEFSPTGNYAFETINGNFLYGTARDSGCVYQWDLSTQYDATQFIKSNKFLSTDPEKPCGSLQMAPNGRIYVAYNEQDFIGVINSPTRPFPNCGFKQKGARLINNDTKLGGLGTFGLPAPIPGKKVAEPFYFENLCEGDETLFYITDQPTIIARNWIIQKLPGGAVKNFPKQTNDFTYKFPSAGEYKVVLLLRRTGVLPNLTYTRKVVINTVPVVKLAAQDYTILCPGDSLPLEAGSGAFYKWEDPNIQLRRRVIPSDSVPDKDVGGYRDFRVTVTGYNGCSGWDTVYIAKTKPPVIDSVHTTSAFCHDSNGSAIVYPHGRVDRFTYRWDGRPEKTNFINNIDGGDYIIHVASTTPPFCETTDTVRVPQIGGTNVKMIAVGDSIVCPGSPLTLRVTGADEVSWLNPAGKTDFEITVNPSQQTVYNAIAITRDAGRSCPTPVNFTAEVHELKVPKIGNDTTACEGQVVRIPGEAGFEIYQWSNGQTDQIARITENTMGLTLTVTDKNSCITTSAPVSISFDSSPAINLGRDTAYCSKDPIILYGGLGERYSWNEGEGTESTFSVVKSGDYRLEIFKGKCSSRDTIHIQLNDPTALKINGVTVKDISCFGGSDGSIKIDAKGEGLHIDYSIDGGTVFTDNAGLFENLPLGTGYKVQIREDGVCYNTWEPLVSIRQPDQLALTYCALAPSAPNGKDGVITFAASGGTPPYDILLDGNKINGNTIFNLGAGTFSLDLTDKNKCQLSKNISLTAGARLNLITNHDTICPGSAVDISVINGDEIEWIGLPGRNGTSITENPLVTTVYHVRSIRTQTDGTKCESTDSITVNVTPDFTVSIGNLKDNNCFVSPEFLADGSVEIKVVPSGNYEYSIDEGNSWQTSPEFKNLIAADDYSFRVRDNLKCTKEITDIAITQPDSIHVSYRIKSPNCVGCSNGQIIIKSITGGTPGYRIFLDGKETESPMTGLIEGKYQLMVTDKNECTRIMDIPVDMNNLIPNVITPNNDLVNDKWTIPMLVGNPDCEVSVYDLNRQLVFYSQGYDDGWDGIANSGKNSGTGVPAGTYFYIINTHDGDPIYTGSLTVIR